MIRSVITFGVLFQVMLGVAAAASEPLWSWVKGQAALPYSGHYGTQGAAAPENRPSGRWAGHSWIDGSGRFWLFGGRSHDAGDVAIRTNDLWRFDPATGNWTWIKGSNVPGLKGIYGTQGMAAAANTPGARSSGVTWVDQAGRFWLFGGFGRDAAGNEGILNDLWRFDPATGNWTWISGGSRIDQKGTYGTQGLAAAGNTPGARWGCGSWSDGNGRFWIFGGKGWGATNNGLLNDLWMFDPDSAQWTWVKGSQTVNQAGNYGTQGAESESNNPGGRYTDGGGWMDGAGRFWIFGGLGRDSAGAEGHINDLWRFNPATGNWTWIKGGSTINQKGVYGTQGAAAAGNTPGARHGGIHFRDGAGRLLVFGGLGRDAAGADGYLSDLWRFDPVSGNWTWLKGSNAVNHKGYYGAQGTAAAANTPGARYACQSRQTDQAGRLWVYGGYGRDAAGAEGELSDLWQLDPATMQWTWIKGDNLVSIPGSYGNQGVEASANTPGGRENGAWWADPNGKLWVFGGGGPHGISDPEVFFNDLWRYDPISHGWTWIKGSNQVNQHGIYGTQGIEAPANAPGARHALVNWIDGAGRLWLFGGAGYGAAGSLGRLNDLWRYNPATGSWTWVKGVKALDQNGVYGIQGTAATANSPGGRWGGCSWIDHAGRLWMLGGRGNGASGGEGLLNDLWMFNPATGNWTWVKGSSTVNPKGIYGTQGVATETNTPGGRRGACAWVDRDGRIWLFGGYGRDGAGNEGGLSDLWRFDPATGQWTWVKGASTINQKGAYGTRGTAAAANAPGGRWAAGACLDSGGKFYLFGGIGRDAAGKEGKLNDLWVYDGGTEQWTWLTGSQGIEQAGVYGGQGSPAPGNTPGARTSSSAWMGSAGCIWLFGGIGYDASGSEGYLDDLWLFIPGRNAADGAAWGRYE